MKNRQYILLFFMILLLASGCAVYLPYQRQTSHLYLMEVRKIKVNDAEPITIKWIPPSFPSRVDTQGASGFVGSMSMTKVPTGIAITTRLTEILDNIVGVQSSSPHELAITVKEAKTRFKYRMGLVQNTTSWGKCIFEATFDFRGQEWSERFEATVDDKTLSETNPTAVLDEVWENISLQIAKNIAKHLNDIGFKD